MAKHIHKFVLLKPRGKPARLVNTQILRWREARRKAKLREEKLQALNLEETQEETQPVDDIWELFK